MGTNNILNDTIVHSIAPSIICVDSCDVATDEYTPRFLSNVSSNSSKDISSNILLARCVDNPYGEDENATCSSNSIGGHTEKSVDTLNVSLSNVSSTGHENFIVAPNPHFGQERNIKTLDENKIENCKVGQNSFTIMKRKDRKLTELSEYLEEISAIKYDMNKVENTINFLQILKDRLDHASTVEMTKKLQAEASQILKDLIDSMSMIQKRLEDINHSNDGIIMNKGFLDSEMKIKQNLEQMLRHKFSQVVKLLQVSDQCFNFEVKSCYNDSTESNVSESTVDSEMYLHKGRSTKLENDARSRLYQLIKLQKTIENIHNSYKEVGYIIGENQNMIDNIDKYVTLTKDYTEIGTNDLRTAKKYRDNAHRQMFWLSLLLFVIGTVALFPILSHVFTIKS